MNRSLYAKVALVIFIFAFANFFPSGLMGSGEPDLSVKFYPNPPHNVSFLNTDTTLTLRVQNKGDKPAEFSYIIKDKSENLFVNGRDGEKLPIEARVEGNEEYYQSFALVPSVPKGKKYYLTMSFFKDNDHWLSRTFYLRIFWPDLEIENLKSIISNESDLDPSQTVFHLIPRYRRYWHPNRSEIGENNPGYLWLAIDNNRNVMIDDGKGEIVYENLVLPWEISSPDFGEANIWNGTNFVKKRIPSVIVEGDVSYNLERYELYFAFRGGNPAWISRRTMYWTEENLVRGSFNEVPDTERIEYWVSSENGDPLFTVSDYHHHAFRYDPVESYTIQDFYHCPLAEDQPLLWFDFTLGNYKVYSLAEIKEDHLGFTERKNPVERVFEENLPIIKRNFIVLALAVLVFAIPYLWNRKRLD